MSKDKMPTSISTVANAMRLQDKVAIITGGAGGIGASTAKLFLENGAKVIIADIQDDIGLSFCNSLNSDAISYVHCDVAKDSDVENLVNVAISKYGKLDIMYSNAGIAGKNEIAILGTKSDDFKTVLDVNLYGAFLGAKHAARVMIPNQKGIILFTASISAVTSGICSHSYTVSKAGIVALSKNLSVELGQHGIRVNCISPTAIATPLFRRALGGIDKSVAESISGASSVLKGAVPKEEDVANAAMFLASDEAKVVTGHNLIVDAGYSVTNPSFHFAIKDALSL